MPPATTQGPTLVMPRLLRWATTVGAFVVFAGIGPSLWFQYQATPRLMPWSVICAGWASGAMVIVGLRQLPSAWFVALSRWLRRDATGIAWPILVGMILRLAVALVVQPTPADDGEAYLALAQELVASHRYGTPGALAYWPPGLPFFLAPFVRVCGPGLPALILYGLSTFLIAAFGVERLGRGIGLGRRAVIAVWLLACWPTLVLCTGLPEKELLLVAVLPWIAWCATKLLGGSPLPAIVGGVLLGLAILCQPSLMLLPLLPLLLLAPITGAGGSRAAVARRGLLFLGGALVVVLPWVVRNHAVLDAAVVATNGGGNLYGANNDLATGGYDAHDPFALNALGEVAHDRRARQLAVAWIVHHPARLVQLTAGRVLLFAGDDSYGAFAALRRGRPASAEAGVLAYDCGKALAMLPWLLLWAAATMAVTRRGVHATSRDAMALVTFVPYFYLAGIHAVFESNGKYHLPALGCLFVGVVWLVVREPAGPHDPSDTAADADRQDRT